MNNARLCYTLRGQPMLDLVTIRQTPRFAALTEAQLAVVGLWVQDIMIKFDGVSQAPLADIWGLAFDLRDRTVGDITIDHAAFIVSSVFRYRNMEELVDEMFSSFSTYFYEQSEVSRTFDVVDVVYAILSDKVATDIEKANRLDLKVELRHLTSPVGF